MTTLSFDLNLKSFAMALVATAAIIGFSAGPAEAASEKVAFQAAELASKGGRAAIDARVEAAAERVCAAGGVDRLSRIETRGYKACVSGSVAKARNDVAETRTATMVASR